MPNVPKLSPASPFIKAEYAERPAVKTDSAVDLISNILSQVPEIAVKPTSVLPITSLASSVDKNLIDSKFDEGVEVDTDSISYPTA